MTEELDAIVIGASTRGLIGTYVLSTLGFRAILVDKAPAVGAADGSFQLDGGTWFDFGMHVLDEMRSPIATRLFSHVLGPDRVNRTKLQRAIVVRGHIIPYASPPAEMPAEIRALLASDDLIDDIGDRSPTRRLIAEHYGQGFADLICDEVLASYPTESRHLEFGVDESELLVNIYPWFFPRAQRSPKSADISRAFHDKLRQGIDQYVLYPREGGFGAFARAFLDSYDEDRIEVILGARDIEIVRRGERHCIDHIATGGRKIRAPRYFWASGWPTVCELLDIECQDPVTDRIVLGSFRMNRPPNTRFNEILVGDPAHRINRISFPGAFCGSDQALLQIEFAFPLAQSRPLDGDFWRTEWLESLSTLGLIDSGHDIELFDFKTRPLHFNGYGMEGRRLIDADAGLLDPDSNVFPIVPSMANWNLNMHVPMDIEYVTHVLADAAR